MKRMIPLAVLACMGAAIPVFAGEECPCEPSILYYDTSESSMVSGEVKAFTICGTDPCQSLATAFNMDSDMGSVLLDECYGNCPPAYPACPSIGLSTRKQCTMDIGGTSVFARSGPSATYSLHAKSNEITAGFGTSTNLIANVSGACCGIAEAKSTGHAAASVEFEVCEGGCLSVEHFVSAILGSADEATIVGAWSITGPGGFNESGGRILGDPSETLYFTVIPGTYTFFATFDCSAIAVHATDVKNGECAEPGPHDTTVKLGYSVNLTFPDPPCEESQAEQHGIYNAMGGDALASLLARWDRSS